MRLAASTAIAAGACLAWHQAAPPAASPPLEQVIRLEVDAPALSPVLQGALPVMVEASLESSGGWEVIRPEPGKPGSGERLPAGWRLQIGVTGKGPWKVAARALPSGSTAHAKLTAKRVTFSDMKSLATAIDGMSADLHAQWVAAGLASAGAAPAPLARALSGSADSVQRYAEALPAFRSGSAADASQFLARITGGDPGMAMTSVQKGWLDLTMGARPAPCAASGEPSVLAQQLCSVFGHLAAGEAEAALQQADRMAAEGRMWGQVTGGLALAALGRSREALEGWRRVDQMEPGDARAAFWLGRAAMAAGDFKTAAGAMARARSAWPDLWLAYTLEAESRARLRDTVGALTVLEEMRRQMDSRHVIPSSEQEVPELMMGSLKLMEGHFGGAVDIFAAALDRLEREGAPVSTRRTLLQTVVEMKRDLVMSRDPLARGRQLKDAEVALARLESALPASEREARPWPLLRLSGLLLVKKGETADAWRTVERIRSHAGKDGYTDYEDAYLSAAIMLKEGDHEGALVQFKRVAQVRGHMVDVMDLAQIQSRMRKFDEARASFALFDERLSSWDPMVSPPGELVLADPHLSLLVPLYHLARAQFGFLTGDPADSRLHYGRMLTYFRSPDEQFLPYVHEAMDRGAKPE
ncbi:MAG: tetratricopeptide repeat protein [Candidatus Polarisedimenticolia bacterium]